MSIAVGDQVQVHYTGTFPDGKVFDSSLSRNEPLGFKVGAGQMIKGFDEAVVGMELDEKKSITLQPEEAYGATNPDLILKFPVKELPEDLRSVEPGAQLGLNTPNGQQPATVLSIDENEITLDANHPMAGKVLNFDIQVVKIN